MKTSFSLDQNQKQTQSGNLQVLQQRRRNLFFTLTASEPPQLLSTESNDQRKFLYNNLVIFFKKFKAETPNEMSEHILDRGSNERTIEM